MSKSNKNELIEKIINLSLVQNIESIKLYINTLEMEIKFYQAYLQHLENTKPLFFQRKKLDKYNKEVAECEEKIRNIYLKIEQEISEIEKIKDEISSH